MATFDTMEYTVLNSNMTAEFIDLKRGCIHINFIKIGQILIKLRPHQFFSYLAPKKVIFEWIWLLFDTMEYTIQNSNIAAEFIDLQRGCIHISFIKIGQILIKLHPHPFFSYLAPKKWFLSEYGYFLIQWSTLF